MMRSSQRLALVITLAFAGFTGCGDGDGITVNPPTPPPPPSVFDANIRVRGNGNIIVHPSADPTFLVASEFPIRIQEITGGTAIWNFFRVSFFVNGVEIERSEQGANVIRDAGFRDISARTTTDVSVITRNNALDWDDVELLLGFTDVKDGRQIEQMVSLDSFDGVLVDPTPALIPDGSAFSIVETADE